MIDSLVSYWNSSPDWVRAVLGPFAQIVVITVILILSVAYLTLAERKVIGYMAI